MPKAFPVELRERVLNAVEGGMKQKEASRVFQVGQSTIEIWRRWQKQGRSLETKIPSGRPRKFTEEHDEWLKAQVEKDPYASSYALTEQFNRAFDDITVHRSTVLQAMHRLRLSYKKNTVRART